jgi:hypothetical protein
MGQKYITNTLRQSMFLLLGNIDYVVPIKETNIVNQKGHCIHVVIIC